MDLSVITGPVASYILPILLVLIVVEYVIARHHYILKESLSSFAIAIVASIVASFTKVWALAVFFIVFEATKDLRVALLGFESMGWAWYIWVLCIFADDFNFYWHHRFCHSVRLLWAFHVPHHSSDTYNLTIALRNGWFITLYKPVYWLWLPLLGFEPLMVAACLVFNGIWQIFLHSQLVPSWGKLEYIFNTPYIHQVHHSCNVEYLDKNHGGIFSIWDRLFGTFQNVIPGLEKKWGVLKPPGTYNPIRANTHEFEAIWKDVRNASSFSDKLKYIFYPPGWSPDNSTLTAKQMQQQLAQVEQAA